MRTEWSFEPVTRRVPLGEYAIRLHGLRIRTRAAAKRDKNIIIANRERSLFAILSKPNQLNRRRDVDSAPIELRRAAVGAIVVYDSVHRE